MGFIIYNIYRDSGCHILLSNIPKYAYPMLNSKGELNHAFCGSSVDNGGGSIDGSSSSISGGKLELVSEESILDTLEYYIGIDTVDSVYKLSDSLYLAKFKLYNDCEALCNIINKKQMGNNIIGAEVLKHLEHQKVYSEQKDDNREIDDIDEVGGGGGVGDVVGVVGSVRDVNDNSSKPVLDSLIDNLAINLSNNSIGIELSYEVLNNSGNVIGNDSIGNNSVIENKNVVADGEIVANVLADVSSVANRDIVAEVSNNNSIEESKKGNLLVVDLAYGAYNKVCNVFRFFTGR